uniref:Ubiquitin-like protease family profile domain-containing protein n=1 Tax=Lactuca sativa TaxID=4236 RepID=A0A9R1X024_LACSA|nr:hypothetical protein LSAT_V11C800403260 [Lactuca sativa]
MFSSQQSPQALTWHAQGRFNNGKLTHPRDTASWKLVDSTWKEFGQEKQNLRLALFVDGISPHKSLSYKRKGIETKSKKKEKEMEKQNMKTRIRIDKSSILKMSAIMANGQVTKVDSIKVWCDNNLFGYDSYTYLTWDNFEALLTLDEVTNLYDVLFNKIKYGPPERDHGICFINSVVISPSTCKGKSKNIDAASRGVLDRLSTRKDNDIIILPYNLGRHWVLAVLDMKSDTCYYLDSLGSRNFNISMVLYATQSGSNKRIKLNWCPVQARSTECGYYMSKFIKGIVEEGIEVLVKDNHLTLTIIIEIVETICKKISHVESGKIEYTTDDIDEIREEWSEFVIGFIYR